METKMNNVKDAKRKMALIQALMINNLKANFTSELS